MKKVRQRAEMAKRGVKVRQGAEMGKREKSGRRFAEVRGGDSVGIARGKDCITSE